MPVFNGVGTSYNDTSENYGAYAFTTLDTSADKSGTTYDYVFLGDPTTGEDIFGADESFEGLDLTRQDRPHLPRRRCFVLRQGKQCREGRCGRYRYL